MTPNAVITNFQETILPPHYQKPQYLYEQLGNNAFDFAERKKDNPHPQIYVPSLVEGSIRDAAIGNYPAFEALDDNQTLSTNLGLKNFIVCHPELGSGPSNVNCPIYLFDNHNHAFYFWHFHRLQHPAQAPYLLIHIDQHRDSRIPPSFLTPEESLDPDKVFSYTNEILNVGNFIPPAVKTGLISEIIFLDSQKSLSVIPDPIRDLNLENKNYILDIDLDFFAPELNYIPEKLKIETIKKLLPQAKLITIATSPFFIDQGLALKKLEILF